VDTQPENKSGFTSNLWVQMVALFVVVVVLIALAAKYIW
jgi:hypothetical protein